MFEKFTMYKNVLIKRLYKSKVKYDKQFVDVQDSFDDRKGKFLEKIWYLRSALFVFFFP